VALGGATHADPKREVPDYDGRGNPDADAESWPLWIPRILLSPLYVANEYVLRRPLGEFVSHAERRRWTDSLAHLFRFGEGGNSLLAPTATFDYGVLPSVGIYYSRDHVLGRNNALELHAATWGARSIALSAGDRYAIDRGDRVWVRLGVDRLADNLFFGVGPDATSAARSRYGTDRIDGGAGYRRQLAGPARIDVQAGIHRLDFIAGDCCGDPSLDARIARGDVMPPPGYRDGYTAGYGRVDLALDTRRPRPDPGSGGYLDVHGAPSADLRGGRSWVEYGGVLGGALDLTGYRRTLRAQLALDFVDSAAGAAVPFTEYPMLGGDGMAGFVAGWLIGRSTAAAQLAYTWPVWLGLDAQARVALGNAFGTHLAGAAARRLRMSGDLGLATSSERDSGFEILLGLGTETFEQGGGVTSVRVMFGPKRGF
jgi:hypothetical protein